MWIAMFTLTDDVLSQEILNAWERKVDVKDRAVWDIFGYFNITKMCVEAFQCLDSFGLT